MLTDCEAEVLIIVSKLLAICAYIWFGVTQHLAIWSLCTLMLSTALLNVGWILFARMSQGKEPSVLFESMDNHD